MIHHIHLEWLPNSTSRESEYVPIYIHFRKLFESELHGTFALHHINHDTQFVEVTMALTNMQVPLDVQQYTVEWIREYLAIPGRLHFDGHLNVIITRSNATLPMNLNNVAGMVYEGGDLYRVDNNDELMELQYRLDVLSAELRDLYDRADELDTLASEEDIESEEIERATFESMEAHTPMSTPASKSAVDELEKVRVEGVDVGECSICWEEFKEGSEATKLPCEHVYHGDCVVKWLEISHQCPLCRFELPPLAE